MENNKNLDEILVGYTSEQIEDLFIINSDLQKDITYIESIDLENKKITVVIDLLFRSPRLSCINNEINFDLEGGNLIRYGVKLKIDMKWLYKLGFDCAIPIRTIEIPK